MSAERCPACDAPLDAPFHVRRKVPANSCLLLTSRDAAVALPCGDLELCCCPACGLVTNTAWVAELLECSSRYEDTQAHSERFNTFARDLARRWVEGYDLGTRTVLEIGSGRGDFLSLLCDAGVGRAIALDPVLAAGHVPVRAGADVRWIAEPYRDGHIDLGCDAIVCRHTLEHIRDVGDFLARVRRHVGDRTGVPVLFEVPDVVRVLDEVAFWDLYYTHVTYFSPGSLSRLFERSGFVVERLARVFDDQYLVIEAWPGERNATSGLRLDLDSPEQVAEAARRFAATFEATVRRWRERLTEVTGRGGRVAIWGATSKAVAFLGAVGGDAVSVAVDINPRKAGTYLPGTGHPVVAPDDLAAVPPDLIVVMNPVYEGEVQETVHGLGLESEVVSA